MAALIELADAKKLLGIPAMDTSQDEQLSALISAASEMIEVYLRRKLRKGEHTDVAWQQGECLWLRAFPVEAVSEVRAGADLIDIAYVIDKEAGMLRRTDGHPWPIHPEGYTVKYTGGLGTIPAPISQACAMLARQLGGSLENGGVAASERIGDYSITYVQGSVGAGTGCGLDAFSPAISAMLRPWMGRHV